MKKLKERLNNSAIVQFIKKTWSNKKTRSWIGLGVYFIFFLILGILIRNSNSEISPGTSSEIKKQSDISTIILNLETISKSDYNYKILLQDEEITVQVKNGTKSFEYNGYKYIFVYDKLYLDNDFNLELISNLLDSNIPIEYITIDNILNCINDSSYKANSTINLDFNVYYDVSSSKFLKVDSVSNIEIEILGSDNITKKIVINYGNQDYILEIN